MAELTYDQVLQKLLIMETFGLAKDVEKPVVQVWLSLMVKESVTVSEWAQAIASVCAKKTFQVKPVEVLEVITELRQAAKIVKRQNYLASLIEVQVGDAAPMLVPYWRVKDGQLLPEGERNPDALPPGQVKELPAPPITEDSRRATIARMVESAGIEAAGRFIKIIGKQGLNTDIEVDELRRLASVANEAAAETIRQQEAEQAARVKKQISAIQRQSAPTQVHAK